MLWNNFQPKQCFIRTFPILTWLSQYNLKTDLFGDVVSGCTVAVMHIPQGKFAFKLLLFSHVELEIYHREIKKKTFKVSTGTESYFQHLVVYFVKLFSIS